MIDINELRRLAQAATPGPWHATKSVETNSWAVWSDTTRLMELRPTKTVDMYRVSNTAAFIAAANPAAISELLDRLEAAESDALEQARLNGMGASREAALMAQLEDAEKERDFAKVEIARLHDDIHELTDERDALRAKIIEMEEPAAWRTFDGEGGYDYRSYEDNENYKLEWDARNPNHIGWVEPLTLPGAKGEKDV